MWVQSGVRRGGSWGSAQDWSIHSCTSSSPRSTVKMSTIRYVKGALFTYFSWIQNFKRIIEHIKFWRSVNSALFCPPYFISTPSVDREQCVSAEELVLSGAPWNSRLWAVRGGHACQPRPCLLQSEGQLLQLPQEQRSVSEREMWGERERRTWCVQSAGVRCLTRSVKLLILTYMRTWTNKTTCLRRNVNNFPNWETFNLSPTALFVFHWEYWFVFSQLHAPFPHLLQLWWCYYEIILLSAFVEISQILYILPLPPSFIFFYLDIMRQCGNNNASN